MKNTILPLLLVLLELPVFAQNQEWKQPPRPNEKVIEVYKIGLYAGNIEHSLKYVCCPDTTIHTEKDNRINLGEEELYTIYKTALKKYYEKYNYFSLRDFKYTIKDNISQDDFFKLKKGDVLIDKQCNEIKYFRMGGNGPYGRGYYDHYKVYILSATLVLPDNSNFINDEDLKNAVDNALKRVEVGSILAFGTIDVDDKSEIDGESLKDDLTEIILDKGYKMVAKEHLKRLYDESKKGENDMYNKETVVQGNNFSAVGYFIDIKVTPKTIKLEVLSVGEGEIKGQAKINF